MRNRIATACRHFPDLLQNQVVAVAGERGLRRDRDSNKRRDDANTELVHGRISKQ